jgi:hypothetical protein
VPVASPTATVAPATTPVLGGTATAEAPANATTTAQGTAVAQAVAATVTVEVQALATAAMRSAQATVTAAVPTSGPVSPATPPAPTAYPAPPAPSPTRQIAPGCGVQPVRGFGLVYATNPTVASRLGCPVQPEAGAPSASQTFTGGLMLEVARQIFVLRNQGATWSSTFDTYQNGQPLPTPTVVAPPGSFAPVGGFGLVWQQQPGVRDQLGWAVAAQQDFTAGASEEFAHGHMLWTPNRVIYVLYADNTWQSFPDNFQG